MRFEPRHYPETVDSQLPWLGRVPRHWRVERGKWLFDCIDRRSSTGAEELLTVSSSKGVVPRSSTEVTMFKADSYVGHKLCWPGDLVINSLWAWAGGLGVSSRHGIVSTAYGVYRPKPNSQLAPGFVNELVRSKPFNWEMHVRSKGIWTSRLQLTDYAFLGAPLPVPPIQEQQAIARFLDYIDRRIHRYIRAKKKLITLLEEYKQAIINQAVTKGLDPTVKMKSSGIDWLGKIPEHWEIVRLRHLTSSITSGSRGWSSYAAGEGPLFIRIGNLCRGSLDLDLSEEVRLDLPVRALSEAGRTQVEPGDLLMSITAYIGSVAVAPENIGEAYVSQHVACCKLCTTEVNPRWLGYSVLSNIGQTFGKSRMYGGTKQGLSLLDVASFPVLLPKKDEQLEIVEHIERRLLAVSTAASSVREHVELVQEYRTRLISDAVTGKADVRHIAAQLSEDDDKEELLEEVIGKSIK